MSQQINLFNPIFLAQKKYFSVVTMLQALALIVLGSIVFYGYAWYQVQMLAKQTQETSRRYQAEQKRLLVYANEFSPERSNQMLKEELASLEAQVTMQQALLDRLKSGAIGNTQGYSGYMRAFARQAVNGLWLTGFEISGDGTRMSLQGAMVRSDLLAQYIQRLNNEAVMRGKSFSALQVKEHKEADAKMAGRAYTEFVLQSTEASGGTK